MKEIKIKIFEFNELKEEQKERAKHEILNFYYFEIDEELKSINEFFKHFNIKFSYSKIDFTNIYYTVFNLDFCESFIKRGTKTAELKELLNILYNNKQTKYENEIKTLLEKDCPFTGVYIDNILINELKKQLENENNEAINIFKNCFNEWNKTIIQNYNYHLSDENIQDFAEANEIYFFENGTIYNN